MDTQPPKPAPLGASRPRRRGTRLPPRWRRALRAVHVTVSIGLLGSDAAVLVLAAAGRLGSDPVTVYPAAHLISELLLLPLAVLALATGVALGLLTPWGLLRHWWVALSLAFTAAGTVLGALVLVPGLGDAASSALAGQPVADPTGLVRDAGAACCVLIATVVLSYVKPFGTVRRGPRMGQPGP
ncbi:hypothetical protein SAMN05216223_12599 [Actinacidiphila yanglinensis]|uniref:DUF2269 domain-containing protein n=1 Tax=Actinacidiphila yanglinensis TaxID=310779 RepID=A0A1H6E3J4_9ACTN|nr:hypothetical protein [Actinacidiphila yanglinensis]SEG92248.1 hypothetical protein SAMN05216223_12599 [Actinacidiphila yanglinensis]